MSDADSPLTAARVRERLSATCLPDDPTRATLPSASPRWPADFLARAARGLTPAGVLIPLIDRDDALSVLLTRRSAALKLHAGQVSFPGGRMETGDRDIEATALRETEEEIGIAPRHIEIAGYLPPSPTVTGYSVTPVVGLLQGGIRIEIDRREVDAAFEVPLDFLMAEANQRHTTRRFQGVEMPIVEFHYAGHRVWGATATMLIQLRKLLIL
jgi:8-oxo-dGTP pyrophosphatase MutT (NUDIX family)